MLWIQIPEPWLSLLLSKAPSKASRTRSASYCCTQNPPPTPAPAAPAPVLGPDFSAPHPAPKTVLQLNSPAIFDGNQTQGQMLLYSVLTYYWLVPEAFMADGFVSQEKLVWFAMSFMLKAC
jgi:hypothetical protein